MRWLVPWLGLAWLWLQCPAALALLSKRRSSESRLAATEATEGGEAGGVSASIYCPLT